GRIDPAAAGRSGVAVVRAQQPLAVARPVAVARGLALVVGLLALGQGQLDLDLVALPVHRGRHQGVAFALDPADQIVDLAPVQQQLAGPLGVGDHVGRGLGERGDLGAEQVEFGVADHGVGLADAGAAGADGLELPALQRDPGLEPLFEVVVVARAPVQGDGPVAVCLILSALFSHPAILPEGGRRREPDAHDRTQRPGRALRQPDVRPGQRRPRLSPPFPVVRARRGAGAGRGADVGAAGTGPGGLPHLVHHREHARSPAPDRHGPARRSLPPAAWTLAVPCAGRKRLQGVATPGFRAAAGADAAGAVAGHARAGRPDGGRLRARGRRRLTAMRVQVVRAWPERFDAEELDLPRGATVADALAATRLPLDGVAGVAVHGTRVREDTPLAGGDRIELLGPLVADPNERRRRRA